MQPSVGPRLYTKSCLYANTKDNDLVLGTLPNYPQVSVTVGCTVSSLFSLPQNINTLIISFFWIYVGWLAGCGATLHYTLHNNNDNDDDRWPWVQVGLLDRLGVE